jgi:hypothetical protein
MTAMDHRPFLLALAVAALPLQQAQAQAGLLQGAWLEGGSPCASVFVATPKALAFKRPASAFAQAFIVSGRRLSTPLATCGLAGVSRSGERLVLRLDCTTSVAPSTARAVLSPAGDGSLYRHHSLEGGIATRYQRCTRDSLKLP